MWKFTITVTMTILWSQLTDAGVCLAPWEIFDDATCVAHGYLDCDSDHKNATASSVEELVTECTQLGGQPLAIKDWDQFMELETYLQGINNGHRKEEPRFKCSQQFATTGIVDSVNNNVIVIAFNDGTTWTLDRNDPVQADRLPRSQIRQGFHLRLHFKGSRNDVVGVGNSQKLDIFLKRNMNGQHQILCSKESEEQQEQQCPDEVTGCDVTVPTADSSHYICYAKLDPNTEYTEPCGYPFAILSMQQLAQLEAYFAGASTPPDGSTFRTMCRVKSLMEASIIMECIDGDENSVLSTWTINLSDATQAGMLSTPIDEVQEGQWLMLSWMQQQLQLSLADDVSGEFYLVLSLSAAAQAVQNSVNEASRMTIRGDPHYQNCDGKRFSFQGACRYILAETCVAGDAPLFQISGRNRALTQNGARTFIENIIVKIHGVEVEIDTNSAVKVNGTVQALPYNSNTVVIINTDINGVPTTQLETSGGLKVTLSQSHANGNVRRTHKATINIPAEYAGRLCGLSGNFNGDAADDDNPCYGNSIDTCTVWEPADGDQCRLP